MKGRGLIVFLLFVIILKIPYNHNHPNETIPSLSSNSKLEQIGPNDTTQLIEPENEEKNCSIFLSSQLSCETLLSVIDTQRSSSNAILTGQYWDYGNDTDGDGKFNQLVIVIEVNITLGGNYTITAELNSNQSDYSWNEKVIENKEEGNQNITIPFEVQEVYSEQLNTSYRIIKTQILSNSLLIDEEYSNYTTRQYQYDEFDPPKIYLTGSYRIRENYNEFGFINRFYLEANFEFAQRGYNHLNLSYTTVKDNSSYWVVEDVFREAGNHDINFYLEPTALYLQRINTAYNFTLIEITDVEERRVGHANINITTREYNYNEFAPPAVIPSGFSVIRPLDMDDNRKFDTLSILIGLDITANVNSFKVYVEVVCGSYKRSAQKSATLKEFGLVELYVEIATLRNYLIYTGQPTVAFDMTYIRISHLYGEIIYESEDILFRTERYRSEEFDSPPVAIEGNQIFDYFAALEEWKGEGTDENPYIIQDLVIDNLVDIQPIIEIRNTTRRFIIRNCRCVGSGIGIRLIDVSNAELFNITIIGAEIGIELQRGTNITINGNYITSENTIGMIFKDTKSIISTENEITNASQAIVVINTRNIQLINNNLSTTDGEKGIILEEVFSSMIINNTIEGFLHTGIKLHASSYCVLDHNFFIENRDAIEISGTIPHSPHHSRENRICNNLVIKNRNYCIIFEDLAMDNIINGNTFSCNRPEGSYLAYDDGINNMFQGNYWNTSSEYIIQGDNKHEEQRLTFAPHLSPPIILRPNGGENLTREIRIHWDAGNHSFNMGLNYTLYFSDNNGTSWNFLTQNYSLRFTFSGKLGYYYNWEINYDQISPGTNYLIKVEAVDPLGFTIIDTSDYSFSVSLPPDPVSKTQTDPRMLFFTGLVVLFVISYRLTRKRNKF